MGKQISNIKYIILTLAVFLGFSLKIDSAFAQVDCGWSCSGTTASCKAGGDYNWAGYCDDGTTGNCHEYCAGSIDADVNCGGAIQHISCNTFTKQQDGCCRTSPQG